MLKAYTGYNPCGCGPTNYNLLPITCTQKCQEDIGCIYTDAKCTTYTGEDLNNIGVIKGENLEEILIKINQIIATGGEIDYSSYDTACLSTYGTVATQSQFVATISNFVCTLKQTHETFVNTTYSNFVTNITNTVNQIINPGTTGCETFVIPNGSTIQQILQLIVNRICSINTFIDISSVDWEDCITTLTTPTNLSTAFTEVLRQICIVKNSIPTDLSDTYKVKLTSGDTTEDYLKNKIKGTSCVSVTEVTDAGVQKLEVGLNFSPEIYTFNPAQFTITDETLESCPTIYNISLSETLGTVSSVALSTPSIFNVSGSPVTTTGTLSFSLANQSAGLVFAGPTTGSAAAPTFRSLVTTDLSNQIVTYPKIQNVTSSRLLGNPTGGSTSVSEISIGDGLEFSGTSLKVSKPLPNCTQFDEEWTGTTLGVGVVGGGDLLNISNASALTVVSFGSSKSTILSTQSPIQYKFNSIGELIVRGSVRLTFTITSIGSPSSFTILLGSITPGSCFGTFENSLVLCDSLFIGETQASKMFSCYVGLKDDGTLFLEVKGNYQGTAVTSADINITLDGTSIPIYGI